MIGHKFREGLSRFLSSLIGQLTLVISAFVVISFVAGAIARALNLDYSQEDDVKFQDFGDAWWWAFMHMSDTGYLGDDQGDGLRLLAVVVTLLGALLVLVFLIAILARALDKMVNQMALAYRPVKAKGHLVCIGWNERLPELLGRLVASVGRVRQRFGSQPPQVFAVLAPLHLRDKREEMLTELRRHCGYLTPRMPFGRALEASDFELVSAADARLIVVPARSRLEVDPNIADVDNIKIGLSLANHIGKHEDHRRTVTVEFHTWQNLQAAKRVLPSWYNLVASDQLAAQVLAPSLMLSGIGTVLYQLLGGGGKGYGLYLVKDDRFVGRKFADFANDFDLAVPVGLFRGVAGKSEVRFAPPPDTEITAEDEIIMVAENLATATTVEISREDVQIADLSNISLQRSERKPSRVLVVGWNARIVSLVAELKDHASGKLYLTSLSAMSTQQRQRLLRGLEGDDIEFDLIEGSPSDLSDLRRIIEEFDPEAVVIMSSEVVGDPHRADAQALICYLHLDGLLSAKGTPIVVELFFPEDADSFELSANTDIIATDSMIAYFLSQVALRPEIADTYYGLLGAQGARLDLLDYDAPKDTSYSFNQVFQALSRRNIIMIGYLHGKDTHLVPPMDRILPNNSRLVVVCGNDSDLAAPN